MIPIQLKIQGLYSYQKQQTIDFTKLTAGNLFGIFGSVGSGKSSILEAVTFALYGKTDRLNLSGDNRNYNMMNLKSNELLIDFKLETGKDQAAYRAVVHGKRNSKQFHEVKKLDRTAYKYDNEKWIPIELSQLEEAIGLSYENFKRTIIIPQGQFQEFLQLGNKDRTKMMKELFNLEKFELYYKVASLENKNNEQKQLINGQLQQLGEIAPEQVKAFNTQLSLLEKELHELVEALKSKENEEKQLQQTLELSKQLDNVKVELEQLQKKEAEFIELENTLLQYETCVLKFKSMLDSLETSNNKISQKTQQINTDSDILQKQKAEITVKENVLNELKPAFEKRELLKQKAEELDKLSKIIGLENNMLNENNRLLKGNTILSQTVEKLKSITENRDQLSQQVKLDKKSLPDLNLLSKIKSWFVEKENNGNQKTGFEKEINKLGFEKKQISDSFNNTIDKLGFNELCKETEPQEAIVFLQKEITSSKTKIAKIEDETNHLRVQAQLGKYAEDLNDDKPCPLCGSVHHPKIYNATQSDKELLNLEKLKRELEGEIKIFDETISRIKELEQNFKFNAKNNKDWKAKVDAILLKEKAHIYDSLWPEYKNLEAIEIEFENAVLIQTNINNNEIQVEKITNEVEKEVKNKERFQLEIEKIKRELNTHETVAKTLQKQLQIISQDHYKNKTTLEIKSEKEALIQQYSQIEKEYSKITTELTDLHKTSNNLSGIITANKNELEQEHLINNTLSSNVNRQLEQSDYTSVDDVKKILKQEINIEQQKKKIVDFNQKLSLAKSLFNTKQKEMEGKNYDAEQHQKIKDLVNILKEQQTEKNQEFGKIKELLAKLQKDMESQVGLQKSLEALEFRAENIKTLKSLFKASGFVNYISSVYLQNLCNAANDRFFQLTRQKLSLEITEDNNFQVRDFMNGGKVRNVKTLSGGQTFQAALSLALALADNIQKITESNQNFFFLDEGFGSLDKESLSVVFDTLKSLRKENRIVGVISHVEEMQQEIDVHLRIENNDDTGSIIFKSWAG